MVDGDVDSAEAVTHTRIAEPQNDGSIVIKHVLESLDSPPLCSSAGQMTIDPRPPLVDYNNDQMQDMSPPQTPRTKKSRVSDNSIKQ